MAHRITGDILYVRHRALAVSDRDWQAMLDDIAQSILPAEPFRILVKTENAGPNSVQRNQLHQLVTSKGATLRVAVMSTSTLVRGIVTAFSWMGTLKIKSFGDDDLAGALHFLESKDTSGDRARFIFTEIEPDVG
jgi:hypothetical protein